LQKEEFYPGGCTVTAKILCVDDDGGILASYELLQNYQSPSQNPFHIDMAPGGEEGLAALVSRGPYAVIISDLNMPGMSGIEFLRRARQMAPDTVRMMMTGYMDTKVAIDAINESNIFRFLTKPILPNALLKAIAAGVEQHRLITAEKELLGKTIPAITGALMEVLELDSPVTFGRASRVQRLVRRLAAVLHVDNSWQIDVAAVLSHLGRVTVPQDILRKIYLGTRLTPEEERTVDDHPRIGHNLLASIPRMEEVAAIVAHQQQHFNGGGVRPAQKHGTDIPLGARILKVALDFDTLEVRDLSGAEALEHMRQRSGWYDPSVLDALEQVVEDEVDWEERPVRIRDLLDVMPQPDFLRETMIFAEDVMSQDEAILLRKGQKITPSVLERLRNHAEHVGVREPIRILTLPEWARLSLVS
jgi:response regulator RpfG family c-di-GMP phosphodiesterase